MPRCGFCGKFFRSNKGLNVHRANVHGIKKIPPIKIPKIKL